MGRQMTRENITFDMLTEREIKYHRPALVGIGGFGIEPVHIVHMQRIHGTKQFIIGGTVVLGNTEIENEITLPVTTLIDVEVDINHEREIEVLRASADVIAAGGYDHELRKAAAIRAVASLLEVHDATGLNLTKFDGVHEWVNLVLDDYGFPPVADNHV